MSARILGELLSGEASHQVRRIRRAGDDPLAAERNRAKALRDALEGLGPLYIKVGQLMSTRPDLVSPAVIEALQDMHEEVMVRPFAEFERVLEQNLGPDWRDRFLTIETERPLGAASMAQVYAATLHDGREVVVKVLRPHVAAQARLDMEILAQAVKLVMSRFPAKAELFQPEAMLETIFVAMRPEIDFTRRGRHHRGFSEVHRAVQPPHGPRRGGGDQGSSGHDARAGALHSGLRSEEQATVIDFGMIGRIDRRTALGYTRFMLAMALNDGQAAGRAVVEMSTPC